MRTGRQDTRKEQEGGEGREEDRQEETQRGQEGGEGRDEGRQGRH